MKKIMILAAVVMAVCATQAASFVWKATGGNIYDGSSSKYTGTAYVFDANVLAQSALFDAFATDSSTVASSAIATLSISAGSVVTTGGANQFSYGNEGEATAYSFYFALVNDDSIYMSNIIADKSVLAPPTAQSLGFSSQNNGSTTFSGTAAAEGFQGAGHWSQAVPEPTSGLLLLLGMAGLALKRKHV